MGFFKEPWPDGFFDDSFNLSMELLTANKKLMNQEITYSSDLLEYLILKNFWKLVIEEILGID